MSGGIPSGGVPSGRPRPSPSAPGSAPSPAHATPAHSSHGSSTSGSQVHAHRHQVGSYARSTIVNSGADEIYISSSIVATATGVEGGGVASPMVGSSSNPSTGHCSTPAQQHQFAQQPQVVMASGGTGVSSPPAWRVVRGSNQQSQQTPSTTSVIDFNATAPAMYHPTQGVQVQQSRQPYHHTMYPRSAGYPPHGHQAPPNGNYIVLSRNPMVQQGNATGVVAFLNEDGTIQHTTAMHAQSMLFCMHVW